MAHRARGYVAIGAVVAVAFVLTLAVDQRYHHRVLTLVFLWATIGLSWNIISGYAGQISFGHQAFVGIGAYATVLLAIRFGLTPWVGMVVAAATAVVAAVFIGVPTFRLAGIYCGLATLAYPLVFRILMDFLGYQEVAIPMVRDRPALYMQFTDPRLYDWLALGVLAATLALSQAIEGSRLGYSLRALKEDEHRAEAGARARALDALAFVGLAERRDALPAALTTLELRLMELARSLATEPRLLLLDEPLAGLAGDGVEVMIALVQGLRARGITVVLIEHTLQALLRLADRFVVLDHGRQVADGAPGEVIRDPAVVEAYLGKRWLRNADGLRR